MNLNASLHGGFMWLRGALSSVASTLFSALVWFLLLAILGIVSIVIGVFVLAGIGAALVVAGISLLLAALLIFKGMTRGA